MPGEKIEKINITAFTSVILAAILLGFIAHELVHVLLIQKLTSVTLYFGSGDFIMSTCCLSSLESANEEIAYFVQAVVTIGWIFANNRVFMEKE